MPSTNRYVLAAVITLGLLLGLGGAASASEKQACYRGSDDSDNDGYARNGATSVEISVKYSEKLNCPKGWVRKAGDTQDTTSIFHPRNPETFNAFDDNCNGKVDEPTFVYPHDTQDRWVNSNSFLLKIKLNNRLQYGEGKRLHVRLRLTDLTDVDHPTTRTITRAPLQHQGDDHFVTIRVTDLKPETVYRVDQVQILDASTSNALGDSTHDDNPYYTTTDGDTFHAQRRTAILLRGLHEFNEDQMGRVGYRGTEYKDGTKYGARKGEQWCSEFYAWVTKPYLEDISRRASVPRLRSFFRQRNEYDRINEDVLQRAKRGDYIAMDIDKDEKKDHSGMFLAYDPAKKWVWLLEGNTSGNQVDVRHRTPDEVDGLGHINSAMPQSNYMACKRYCDSDPKCVKCSTKKGCGPGYKWLRSYTGPGTNYHACAELKRSAGNHQKCEKWCREHSNCAKCDTNVGCGEGYKKIHSFTEGGTNWYACEERSRSRSHREACEEWCKARSECAKCSTKRGCGVGFKTIKSWTGKGTNWHACERR